jgi:hypothetical protein
VAQLRLTRADCQRAASATPSAKGSVVRRPCRRIKGNMVYGPLRHGQFMALFGHGAMSDLSPLHALKRTSTNRPDDGADQHAFLRIYAPSAPTS